MNGKEIKVIIGLIVIIPTLIGLLIWTFNVSNDPRNLKHLEEGTEIIAYSAIPWWLGIFEWLAGLPKIIGAILIIALILFLKWIGEIK